MWGVFHYLHEEETAKTISEIFRVMKPNAHFIGTLRSKKDTHLRGVLEEGDLKSGKAIFYSRRKSIKIFSQFSKVRYGYIMRIPVENQKVIAHHVIEAVK